MRNERLTDAVAALLYDGRLVSRFRRDPAKALRRFGLGDAELDAVKRGNAHELVALGLDPRCVWPEEQGNAVRAWVFRNAMRVSPAVFVAACMFAPPAGAVRAVRARRLVRCARALNRARCVRAIQPPRDGITFTRSELKTVCKAGGFRLIGTRNQGRCVSTVNHAFPDGVTLPGREIEG